MFIVGIFSNGSWKTYFLSIFFIGIFLNDNLLWMLAPCGKNNMYLGKLFICSYIVHHVLIIGCVFYTLCPMSACSCIGHASHMHTRCTFAAHT